MLYPNSAIIRLYDTLHNKTNTRVVVGVIIYLYVKYQPNIFEEKIDIRATFTHTHTHTQTSVAGQNVLTSGILMRV